MSLEQQIEDIKQGQEKMMSILNDLTSGRSNSKIYDLVDLQEILRVSKRTVATWLQRGILPHTKVGAKIWVTKEQLDSFMDRYACEVSVNKQFNK